MVEATTPGDQLFWETLLARKGGRRGLRMMSRHGGVAFSTWDEVHYESTRRASGLRAMGVEPGSVVAGVLDNTYDAVVGLFAVWFAGASFASLPDRPRGMGRPEYHEQQSRIADHCGSAWLFSDGLAKWWSAAAADGSPAVRPWAALDVATPGATAEVTLPPEGSPAVIQYSSGSTGSPKGCMLRPGAIAEQQRILAVITQVSRGVDVECSWMPLSHDMGLFGGLVYACYNDVELALSSPERFMLSPRTWFADLSETGAVATPGTNAALALAARCQRSPLPRPLEVRSGIIGAEPLEWDVLVAVNEVFGPSGLSPAGLRPAYGMAEVTLAASCTPYGSAPRRLVVNREALDHQSIEIEPDDAPPGRAVSLTSCGVSCPDTAVTSDRGEGIGELRVASPSLASGYVNDPNPSRSALRDGLFHSNDVGFVRDGEVYVLGRTDDVLIDAGRNVYLTEIEAAAEDAVGVRKNRLILVDVRESTTPVLVAIVEVRDMPPDPGMVAKILHETVMARCGIPVTGAMFIAKGQLPMTPSGKKQRRRCVQLLRARQLEVVAAVGDAATRFS